MTDKKKALMLVIACVLFISVFAVAVSAQQECGLWCRVVYLFTGKMLITGATTFPITGLVPLTPEEKADCPAGMVSYWNFDDGIAEDVFDANDGIIFANTKLLMHFDENTGSVAEDETGYGNDGTLINGPVWTSGKSNSALEFDGVNDYVNCGNDNSLKFGENASVTLSFWMKPAEALDSSSSRKDIVGKANDYWMFYGASAGKLTWYAGTGKYVGYTTDFSADTWHYVVGVRNSSNYGWLYVDGELKAEGDLSGATYYHSYNFWIGNCAGVYSKYFNGSIDEVAIYSKALTADEILGHYNAGRAEFAEETDGKVGNALEFDGVDDYVKIPYSENLGITEQITVEAWIYPTPPHAIGNGGILWGLSGGGFTKPNRFLVQDSGKLFSQIMINGSSSTVYGPYVTNNAWNHVVYVYDGSEEVIYANGVKGTPSTKTGLIDTGTTYLQIGRGHGEGPHYFFNGTIDEVAIYDRALTEEEIQDHYNEGAGKGYCEVAAVCGNGIIETGEECDDGNTADGDGCSSSCTLEPVVPTCGQEHTAGMVSYWKGDGNADDSYDANDGTLMNGAAFTIGQVGQAFSFDGSDDYVDAGMGSNTIMAGKYMTIESWVYPKALASGINKADSIIIKRGSYYTVLRNDADKNWYEVLFYGLTQDPVYLYHRSNSEIPLNQWTHVATTWDGTDIKMYINGNLDRSIPVTGSITDPNAYPLTIGYDSDMYDNVFNGTIDEVAIYDRALTADEVKQHYVNGKYAQQYCGPDLDGDGYVGEDDNCPTVYNPLQEDLDVDGVGDVCDSCPGTAPGAAVDANGCSQAQVDQDIDGICDPGIISTLCTGTDNCPSIANAGQSDKDSDGTGDACDGLPCGQNAVLVGENCECDSGWINANADWSDGCEVADVDNDGIADADDNCPNDYNPLQEDADSDGIGDVCDEDIDGDGIADEVDNCPTVYNPLQEDADLNGIGDACQDTDEDGILDINDNAPAVPNPEQGTAAVATTGEMISFVEYNTDPVSDSAEFLYFSETAETVNFTVHHFTTPYVSITDKNTGEEFFPTEIVSGTYTVKFNVPFAAGQTRNVAIKPKVVTLPSCTLMQMLDLDGSGSVDINDAIHVLRYITGQAESLGPGKGCEASSVVAG